jgi:hypothetical protein
MYNIFSYLETHNKYFSNHWRSKPDAEVTRKQTTYYWILNIVSLAK